MRTIRLTILAIASALAAVSPAIAFASTSQPAQVEMTGNVQADPGSYVKVELANCGDAMPRILYDGAFSTVLVKRRYIAYPDSNGDWSVNVWPNDLIVCDGTVGNTVYSVQYVQSNGDVGVHEDFQVTSTGPNPYSTTAHLPINLLPPPSAPGSDFTFNSVTLKSFVKAKNGSFDTLTTGSLKVNGQSISSLETNAGAILTGIDPNGATLYNSSGKLVGIPGAYNAALPMFGSGQPVLSVSTTGSCTSNPTVTISAPKSSADGSQATAQGFCINGIVKAFVNFRGGGYTSATCVVTGGGTSSPTCSVKLMGTSQPADFSGVADSTAALQNSIDYAYSKAANSGVTAAVQLPQGSYVVSEPLLIPCDVSLIGDGMASTVISLANGYYDGLTVTNVQNHPDAWDCRGEISNLEISAPGGNSYTGNELTLWGVSGYTLSNLDVSGGGGRGIVTENGTERTLATDIEIDTVRWPLIWFGNEQHMRKLNVASPGSSATKVTEPDGTSGHYCYATKNCVNGKFPSSNWSGGTLEYASANGTTATFYIHSASSTYPNSPIAAGQYFTVGGTTGTDLNGLYKATSVTNHVTSDPSGKCTSSNVCFEVQAASSANGTATLTAQTTTSTFPAGDSTITLANMAGASPYTPVSASGIAGNTWINTVSGSSVTLSAPTTGDETSTTVTVGPAVWKPTIMPVQNSAVDFSTAGGSIVDGSIKSLHYAGCFDYQNGFIATISNFYCEGYPTNGQPTLGSSLQAGGYHEVTSLTSALIGSSGNHTTIKVGDDSWFAGYVGNQSMTYASSGETSGIVELKVVPQDFSYGSKASSAYVSGVERGQYELMFAYAGPNNTMYVVNRNVYGSTAPADTTWPAGSLVSEMPGGTYGPVVFENSHPETTNRPHTAWATGCNDTYGEPCAEYLIGSIPNGVSVFTTGTAGVAAGISHPVMLIDDESWGAHSASSELVGQGFIKGIGRGGPVTSIDSGPNYTGANGNGATRGQLLKEGFVNVVAKDGSQSYSSFRDLTNGVNYNAGSPGIYTKEIRSYGSSMTGSPDNQNIGRQFANSYCFWDTSSTVDGHARSRWCMAGNPNHSSPYFEMDTWNGTHWVQDFKLSSNFDPAFLSSVNTFTNNNTFELTTTFKNSGKSYWDFDSNGNLWEYTSSGAELMRLDDVGNIGLAQGSLSAPYVRISDNSDSGTDDAYFESNAAGEVFLDKGTSNNEAGDGTLNLGTVNATTLSTGSQTVYRCTGAGTLPVGALTTDSSQCGSSATTNLTVH